ncbi:MAG: PHP domain-containing protein [Phycisphaeraceae bacterium]
MPQPAFDCDLHTHSSISDGTDTPDQLVEAVRAAGVRVFALTDHDTNRGNATAQAAAHDAGLGFLPGVELSASAAAVRYATDETPPVKDKLGTLHILGYGIRDHDPALQNIYDQQRAARATRNPEIIERLRRLGYELSYEDVLAEADRRSNNIAVVGRPHIAQALIRRGYVDSVDQAFRTLIGEGKPAYVRRDRLPPEQAIDAIHHAGGVAIVAHPVQLVPRDTHHLQTMIQRLVALGIDGIEIRHSDHNPEDTHLLTKIADQHNLLTTGGSDYHGHRKPISLGQTGCTLEQLARLRDAITARTGNPGLPLPTTPSA